MGTSITPPTQAWTMPPGQSSKWYGGRRRTQHHSPDQAKPRIATLAPANWPISAVPVCWKTKFFYVAPVC